MKTLVMLIVLLSGCKVRPDFTKDGKDYIIRTECVQSHTESKYGYHYGYNVMNGKFEWHLGHYTETICDRSIIDTVEVNIKK
jgi:hypothetical protein